MLENTIVVTFAGSPIHEKYQSYFDNWYGDKFRKHIQFNYSWLKTTRFFNEHQDIFQYEKYCGYFLWKPFIIQHVLEMYDCNNVLYCDVNMVFDNFPAFEELYKKTIEKDHVFTIQHWNRDSQDWTKRDVFVYMQMDYPEAWNYKQHWTSILGFDRVYSNQVFLERYLYFCSNKALVTDEPNIYGADNLPGFVEHRWEQSVFSLLAKKWRYPAVSDLVTKDILHKEYNQELLEYKHRIETNPLQKRV